MCGTHQSCISVGQSVPNFEVEVFDPGKQDFGKISLQEVISQKKWLVLFFYPADFTFVCPTELDDLAGVHEELKSFGCEVVTISTDTKYAHMAWHREEKLLKDVKFVMGSDPAGNIARLFGVYDENTGLALRGTFIISPEGRLTASELNYYNVGRNAEELLRKIKANAYLSTHPYEACPAGWQEGDKTLTPSAGMVGKVFEALKK